MKFNLICYIAPIEPCKYIWLMGGHRQDQDIILSWLILIKAISHRVQDPYEPLSLQGPYEYSPYPYAPNRGPIGALWTSSSPTAQKFKILFTVAISYFPDDSQKALIFISKNSSVFLLNNGFLVLALKCQKKLQRCQGKH